MNAQAMFDNMNGVAKMMTDNGASVEDALERTAQEYGLTLVVESDDGQCRIYEYNGTHINCWMVGALTSEIGDGGAGFDDQTDWYDA